MKIDIDEWLFTGRGSTALWSILKGLNKPDTGILVPVNICEIVIPIIKKAGMSPVYYDVNENSGNATFKNITDAYSGNETVILAVHNFGVPMEIDIISQWAKENNIFLIEDVCNALGGNYGNKSLGHWGDAAIFSFGYAKIIENGVGGAALIRDESLKNEVKKIISSLGLYSELHKSKDAEFQTLLREYRKEKYFQVPSVYLPLYNEYSNYLLYNINEITTKEIKLLLNFLETNIQDRKEKAKRYRNEIKSNKVKHIESVEGQIYWRYNLLAEPDIKQKLIVELRKNDLLVSTWYPPVIGLFEDNYQPAFFSGAISFGNKVINLFVDRRVSHTDISKTVDIINNFLK